MFLDIPVLLVLNYPEYTDKLIDVDPVNLDEIKMDKIVDKSEPNIIYIECEKENEDNQTIKSTNKIPYELKDISTFPEYNYCGSGLKYSYSLNGKIANTYGESDSRGLYDKLGFGTESLGN